MKQVLSSKSVLLFAIALFAVCCRQKEGTSARNDTKDTLRVPVQISSVGIASERFPIIRDIEIVDSLIPYTLFSYGTLENVWYGREFNVDSLKSFFRVITRIESGYRVVMREHSDSSASGFRDVPQFFRTSRGVFVERFNFSRDKSIAKLVWMHRLDFEPFNGNNPDDISVSVSLEKWKTSVSFVLVAGSSRYLVDMSKFPRHPEINVIDDNDNIILAPREDY